MIAKKSFRALFQNGFLDARHVVYVADIEKMLPILEKYGVDYDGWGTYFQE